ncbi:MAG: hypothetical protein KIT14_03930 [bacterium]|nr:hypothetical protein [bacterium]
MALVLLASGAALAAPDASSVCVGKDGVRAVVSIDYDVRETDYDLNAAKLVVVYPASVSLPGTGSADTVRQRVSALQGKQPGDVRVVAHDADAAGARDLYLVVASFADTPSEFNDGVRPGDTAAVQFDCTDGARIAADDFTCRVESSNDIHSNPLAITCTVRVAKQ